MADSTTPTTWSSPTITSLNQTTSTSEGQWLSATLAAQIADKIKSNSINGEPDDLTSFETKKKVDSVKQKIYVFALALIAYLLYTYANTAFNTYNQNANTINELNTQVSDLSTKINTFKSNETTLKQITQESDMNNLITCINNPNLCDKVLNGVKKNLQVTRSYLLLTPLNANKMEIDQKSLLKYFNEYLLIDDVNGMSLGTLLNISFTEPMLLDSSRQIYEVGVDATITFPSKDAMMNMIEKVETWLNPKNPLLIKIKSINYDIVKYEQPQTVNVSFTIYHYKE